MRRIHELAKHALLIFSGFFFEPHPAWSTCEPSTYSPDGNPTFTSSGSSQLSLGQNQGKAGLSNKHLGISSRGTRSIGRWMQEYDLAYLSTQDQSPDMATSTRRSTASYRLAAVSAGFDHGARVYGGNFAAASGNLGGSVGNFFFAHPTMVGLAYKSTGTRLSDYGAANAIRLVLPMESQVRISAGGRELFNGVLGAGDQLVEFSGYQDAFVDVSIRDASGALRTQLAEVMRQRGKAEATAIGGGFWGDIYLDAGRVVDTTRAGTGFRLSDTDQIGFNYLHAISDYLLLAGYQSLGVRRRYAISVAPADRRWQMEFIRGNQMESGYHFSGPLLEWNDLHLSLDQTSYRIPLSTIYIDHQPYLFLDKQNCLAAGSPLCHHATSIDSLGFTLEYQGLPVQMGYIETHTMVARFSAVTITGVYRFSVAGFPLAITGFMARDLERKNNSVFASLSIPLGIQDNISTGWASSGDKDRAVTVSYQDHPEEKADQTLRGLRLMGANSRSPTGNSSAAVAAIDSRLGSVENFTSVGATDRGGRSMESTFTLPYPNAATTLPPQNPSRCAAS